MHPSRHLLHCILWCPVLTEGQHEERTPVFVLPTHLVCFMSVKMPRLSPLLRSSHPYTAELFTDKHSHPVGERSRRWDDLVNRLLRGDDWSLSLLPTHAWIHFTESSAASPSCCVHACSPRALADMKPQQEIKFNNSDNVDVTHLCGKQDKNNQDHCALA